MTDWSEAIEASREPDPVPAAEIFDGRHPLIKRLDELDERLEIRGFPRISEWWRDGLARFYETGRRQFVLRVGRRGGKSSTLCRVGVAEALFGDHSIPPGDTGVVAIIAQKREEAIERLETIDAILTALDVKHKYSGTTIRIAEKNIEFRIYTASIGGVRGGTCICVICDEVCFWRDVDTGANPATEVLASIRPAMSDQPNAKIFLSSSPLGTRDAHAKAFDEGEDEFQCVAQAATWIARPTLTEAECRKLERNEDRFLREYGAIPLEGDEESFLSVAMLDRATREDGILPRESGIYYVAAMDPGFTRNPWTFAIGCMRRTGEICKKTVVCWREWAGSPSKPLDPEKVLREIQELCVSYGCDGVETDQYEKFGLQSIAARIGFHVYIRELGATSSMAAYESLELEMADGGVELPPDANMRADLLSLRRKLTSGGFTMLLPETPDGRHADWAPTLTKLFRNCQQEPETAKLPTVDDVVFRHAQARQLTMSDPFGFGS